ncbi:MAG: hypothetical protein M1358_04645 [Chloroflexi bacterium]|nr:hypothetical protein [Chloroflexota bacterium]
MRQLSDSNRRRVSNDFPIVKELDPQLLNRYTCSRNNPVVYYDPSGKFAFAAVLLSPPVLGVAVVAVAFEIWWIQPNNQYRIGLTNAATEATQNATTSLQDAVQNSTAFSKWNKEDQWERDVVKKYGLNKEGQRALHDRISKKRLPRQDIEAEAEELSKQPKYVKGYKERPQQGGKDWQDEQPQDDYRNEQNADQSSDEP